jgi:LSD1 subclass zinc finger protein
MNKFINFIKSIFKDSKYNEQGWNEKFSISVGEICKSCRKELDLYKGGFKGKPVKCESCSIEAERKRKLKKLGI